MLRFACLAVVAGLLAGPGSLAAQDWRTITQMRQTSAGDRPLRVVVQYGAGTLLLAPGPVGTLYRATMRYDAEAFEPQMTYRSGLLRLGLEDVKIRGRNVRAGELKLALGPTVPIDLHLEFGAAKAELDLGGLRIRNFRLGTGASETRLTVSEPNPDTCERVDLDVGAAKFEATLLGNLNARRLDFEGGIGEVTLDFGGQWRSDLSVDVKMGLGSLTLRVPRGLGLQVRKSGLLVGFDSQGLVKRGEVYFSENWEQAERKLTVNIGAAFGSIRVAWFDADRN